MVKIRTYEGKYIVGWELLENRPEKNPKTGVWEDNQTIRVYFANTEGKDEHKDMPYVTFVRRYGKVPCEVLQEITDKEGNRRLNVQLPDGGELELGVEFVN